MGEKRYSLGEVGWYYTKLIIDNETKHELGNSIVVKTLNEQQPIISKLKEENEQLRKELDNFKPVIFQDMRKGTVILYSKGDIV